MRVRGTEADRWAHVQFGLIVTGETEQRCLADLFRILASQSNCSFKVIRRIAQRSPITSEKRIQKMVGTGKKIPDRDAEQIGFPAWDFLCSGGRFNEKEHGPMIVKRLDVQHVLAQRERCAFLRTMFKWASVAADATAWLPAGCLHSTTMGQIDALEEFLHSGAESKA